MKATEGLFYEETMFTTVIRIGLIVVGSLVAIGLVWDFAYRRRKIRK